MERKINWELVNTSSTLGKLAELLVDPSFPPPSCWDEQDIDGWSILHFCCQGNNEKAIIMLIKAGCNLNLQTNHHLSTPVHFACYKFNSTVLKMLCCAGANLRLKNAQGHEPLDIATSKNVKILLANGVRLCNMKRTPKSKWINFENDVLRCRDVIVTLLGLKKHRRVPALQKLDRFLIKQELAVAIWTTRTPVQADKK